MDFGLDIWTDCSEAAEQDWTAVWNIFCITKVRWRATEGGRQNHGWSSIPHWWPPAMQRLKPDLQLGLSLDWCRRMLTFRAQQYCQVLLSHAGPCWVGRGRCLCRQTLFTLGDEPETTHCSVATVNWGTHSTEKVAQPSWLFCGSTLMLPPCVLKGITHTHTLTMPVALSPLALISTARVTATQQNHQC